MTIQDYYHNYKNWKNYPITLSGGKDKTIADFYQKCIRLHNLKRADVLAWHKMLLEYVDRDDAVFWIRYYEGGNKKSGRWNNRRACMTRFQDGFRYVFVSNYDAHEIFNMVRLGVTPSAKEFADMMNSYTFPLHYDKGNSCEESIIKCYPNIGTTRGGILTTNHWYLAHINGIKSKYQINGKFRSLSKTEVDRIFPRGKTSDWTLDPASNQMVRDINRKLTPDEKEIVKAHFLRFIDPLNYYVVPGDKYEQNAVSYRIGDYQPLNDFMGTTFETLYGQNEMAVFRRRALLLPPAVANNGGQVIDISYGAPVSGKKQNAATTTKRPAKKTSVGHSGSGVGQDAKNLFTNLLENGLLSGTLLKDLLDKDYCSRSFGISFPVIVVKGSGTYDSKRYYKNLVAGKYLICSQWYDRNKDRLKEWQKNQGF